MPTESDIPLDPFDFGQVFACVGLMECEAAATERTATSASRSSKAAVGRFEPDGDDVRFVLSSPAGITIADLIDAVRSAKLLALRPAGSDLADSKVTTEAFSGDERVFPSLPPEKPSALPVELRTPEWALRISSWAEGRTTRRDNAKFWAGNYTGAAVMRTLRELVADPGNDGVVELHERPFDFARPFSSSLRLDWRRDYVPLDSGTSPNDQKHIVMVGHPLVELLAAIGLEHARPQRIDRLNYDYALPLAELPLPLLRAAVGCADIGIGLRRFSMTLGWPGKEGQARCIVRTEEKP